jgi:riboflavin kinase/FMN adenylyltransferase
MMLIAGFPAPGAPVPSTVTIGVFDGMHTGHTTFLRQMADAAHAHGQQAVVVTFDPHPDMLIHPDTYRGLLLTPDERYQRIAACGIDVVVTIAFDQNVRAMTAAEFMARVCSAMQVKTVWVGWDFALGRGRDGTYDRLAEIGTSLGYTAIEVPQIGDATPPSASFIRNALTEGNIAAVTQALGRRHTYHGVVVHGDKRGRTIGFPTANINIDDRLLLPKFGVYATRVTIDNLLYHSVTNIGVRPTFGGDKPKVEAHLLDVTVDVYDALAHVELVAFIRGEQRFDGLDALKTQIARDAQSARAILL